MARNASQRGRLARARGADFEREVVNMAKDMGLHAERVKGSGAHAKDHKDLTVKALPHGGELLVECKRRRDFAQLYKWIDGSDFLAIRGDNKQALAVLPLSVLFELLKK